MKSRIWVIMVGNPWSGNKFISLKKGAVLNFIWTNNEEDAYQFISVKDAKLVLGAIQYFLDIDAYVAEHVAETKVTVTYIKRAK